MNLCVIYRCFSLIQLSVGWSCMNRLKLVLGWKSINPFVLTLDWPIMVNPCWIISHPGLTSSLPEPCSVIVSTSLLYTTFRLFLLCNPYIHMFFSFSWIHVSWGLVTFIRHCLLNSVFRDNSSRSHLLLLDCMLLIGRFDWQMIGAFCEWSTSIWIRE